MSQYPAAREKTMRPGSDEDCDYPHPPPRIWREKPLTLGEAVWGAVVPGVIGGAVIGSTVGLCLGLVVGIEWTRLQSTRRWK